MLLSAPTHIKELQAARDQTDHLFSLLGPQELYERPVSERHRLIFYLGHLEAFDWNLICRGALGVPSFHPSFDKLFEAGIDPEIGQLPSDQPSDWPALSEIQEYKREIRRRLDEALSDASERYINFATEHRLMHAETFAYMLHNRPLDQAPIAGPGGRVLDQNPMIEIPGGAATLGQAAAKFGWDNEFDRHSVQVPPFHVGKYKVTNGEYLRFVEAGAKAPHFWVFQNGQRFLRCMFDLVPLPLDWPVYVTQQEAAEYAEWAGKALLNEAQFHRAAYGTPQGEEREYPWGAAEPTPQHGNFDFQLWDPSPVTAHPAGESAFGVAQLVGNGWEWTATKFRPFAGFKPFSFYPGYSANFFDDSHFVIKGGSPRTAACFLRRSFRNWFRPNYPYVYASFRVVEN